MDEQNIEWVRALKSFQRRSLAARTQLWQMAEGGKGTEESNRSDLTWDWRIAEAEFWNSGWRMGDKRRDFRIDSKHESYNFNDSLECRDTHKSFSSFQQVSSNTTPLIKMLLAEYVVMHFVLMLSLSDEQNFALHILNPGHSYLHVIRNCFGWANNEAAWCCTVLHASCCKCDGKAQQHWAFSTASLTLTVLVLRCR